MNKGIGIEQMNRPFPAGSALSAWLNKWIETLDAREKIATARAGALKKQYSTICKNKPQHAEQWSRLVKRLVAVLQRLPFAVAEKFKTIALEIQHAFSKKLLLADNLNTQTA